MCKLPPEGNMLGCKRILNLEDKVSLNKSQWLAARQIQMGKKVHIYSGEGN